MSSSYDHDKWFTARSDEERAGLRAGALSWPDRKMQRWGSVNNWRDSGPYDWTGCDDVEVVVGKVSGVPVLVGTRMPADSVLQHFEWGESANEIADSFDLNLSQVEAVLRFAGVLVRDAISA